MTESMLAQTFKTFQKDRDYEDNDWIPIHGSLTM